MVCLGSGWALMPFVGVVCLEFRMLCLCTESAVGEFVAGHCGAGSLLLGSGWLGSLISCYYCRFGLVGACFYCIASAVLGVGAAGLLLSSFMLGWA